MQVRDNGIAERARSLNNWQNHNISLVVKFYYIGLISSGNIIHVNCICVRYTMARFGFTALRNSTNHNNYNNNNTDIIEQSDDNDDGKK